MEKEMKLTEEFPAEEYARIEIRSIVNPFEMLASMSSTINEVKMQLFGKPEYSEFGEDFKLKYNNTIISDDELVGNIKGFVLCGRHNYMSSKNNVLHIVLPPYTYASAKNHVSNFRKTVSYNEGIDRAFDNDRLSTITFLEGMPESLQMSLQVAENAFSGDNFDLSHLLPKVSPLTRKPCVQSVRWSVWNPAPEDRMMAGDLFYVDIVLSEGREITVTACSEGFFVNASTPTEFNPQPHKKGDHFASTLPATLRSASKHFKSFFEQYYEGKTERLNFLEMNFKNVPNAPPSVVSHSHMRPKTINTLKSEDALSQDSGVKDVQGLNCSQGFTDWNEMLQSFKDQLKQPGISTTEAATLRKHITNTYDMFNEVAVEGAKRSVDGLLNEISTGIYDYNHIVICSSKLAGTKSTPGKDHAVLFHLMAEPIKGVSTPLSCVVDYRGHRLLCQAPVPGIAYSPKHAYGICNGDKFFYDKTFEEQYKAIAESFRLEPSVCEGQTVPLPAEVQIVHANDSRIYPLESLALFPRDMNYPEDSSKRFRRETVNFFCTSLIDPERVEKRANELRKELEEKKQKEEPKEETEDEKEKRKKLEDINLRNIAIDEQGRAIKVYANPQSKEAEDQLAAMAHYVATTCVAGTALDMSNSLVNGGKLTNSLHNHGLPMRYLGRLHAEAVKIDKPLLAASCIMEGVARCTKTIMRKYFTDLPTQQIASASAHLLNILVKPNAAAFTIKGLKNAFNFIPRTFEEDLFKLTSESLREEIIEAMKLKFGLDVTIEEINAIRRQTLVVRVCEVTGIRINAMNYNFAANLPFKSSDIASLMPVVKAFSKTPSRLQDAIFGIKALSNAGDDQKALNEATELYGSKKEEYGDMSQTHIDVASIFSLVLSSISPSQSYQLQSIATLLVERRYGLTHIQTLESIKILADCAAQTKMVPIAVILYIKVIYLLNLHYGPLTSEELSSRNMLTMLMRNASPVLNIIHRLDKESEQYQEELRTLVLIYCLIPSERSRMNEYLQELEGIAKKKDDENAMKEFVEFKATITKKIEELAESEKQNAEKDAVVSSSNNNQTKSEGKRRRRKKKN